MDIPIEHISYTNLNIDDQFAYLQISLNGLDDPLLLLVSSCEFRAIFYMILHHYK